MATESMSTALQLLLNTKSTFVSRAQIEEMSLLKCLITIRENICSSKLIGSFSSAINGSSNISPVPAIADGDMGGINHGDLLPEGNGWDMFSNNGMLLAVPKKKVSHMKKRQRLYAPGSKQLKMIHHLNKCPSCGHYKLANTLCTYCVQEIRHIWKSHTLEKPQEPLQEQELSDLDKRILYPGKKETAYEIKLKDKDSYLKRHTRSLPVEKKNK